MHRVDHALRATVRQEEHGDLVAAQLVGHEPRRFHECPPTHIIIVHVLADSARGYNFNGTSFPVLEHFPAEEHD